MAPHVENPSSPYPKSGISVVITGAGIAGLCFAMECIRQGHQPMLIESKPDSAQPDGDFFVIGDSATSVLKYWPIFKNSFDEYAQDTYMNWYRHDGTHLYGLVPAHPKLGKILIRKQMHDMMMAEIKRHNVPIIYGDKVVQYFEEPTKGGVVLESGIRITADLVAAGDGVHSRSWKHITGTEQEPISSGFSIFRASMPIEHALASPIVKKRWDRKEDHDTLEFLMGPDTHANMVFGKGTACWLLLHKDSQKETSSESWAGTITPEAAIAIINETPGWDPDFLEFVKISPAIVDWRLLIRNPQPKWASDGGRVIQIGDSAHPFLPTSANGATQAMEDGISLATCLRLGGGPIGVSAATKVHNELRFERVSCSQLSGLLTREKIHKTDWEAVTKHHPELLREIGPGKWLAQHDPEDYAIKYYHECAEALAHGKPFKNTNTPPGYTYKPWNVLDILESAEKEMLVLEGDWL